MSIKSTKLFILASFLALFSSCDLDMMPSDSIEPSKAFRNLEDINLGILGAYAVLGDDLIYSSIIVSDEIRVPTENVVSNTDAHRWLYNSGSGSVTSAFFSLYQAIDRANRVLENLERLNVDPSDQDLKDQYRGELLALRAYAHFELLRGYSADYEPEAMGIQYMKESVISYPPRNSFESNVQDILADLLESKSLIPEGFDDITRITNTVATAMLARLSLYSQAWQDAVDYSSEVIAEKPLASESEFRSIWVEEGNAEVIWKLDRVTGDSQIGDIFFRQSGEIVLYAPSNELLSLYDMENDVRFESYIVYEPERTEEDPGKSSYLVQKYVGSDPSAPGLADIPLFRTGEMYLIRAEAYTELTNYDLASQDLNTLRAARIEGYTAENYDSAAELVDEIYEERFRELAFEGHRFFDLKRRNMNITRLPEDVVSSVEPLALAPTAAQYNFPIPSTEIAVNDNLDQNPEY